MSETKVRLSLNVQGAQLLSTQECVKNPKESYNTEVIPVEFVTKKGNIHKENVVIKTRKQRTVKQCMNICREAYNSMVSPENPPTEKLGKHITKKVITGYDPKGKAIKHYIKSTVWGEMPEKKRLEWHLKAIAEHMRAISFTYEVFED